MFKFWRSKATGEIIEHPEPAAIPPHLGNVYLGANENTEDAWMGAAVDQQPEKKEDKPVAVEAGLPVRTKLSAEQFDQIVAGVLDFAEGIKGLKNELFPPTA